MARHNIYVDQATEDLIAELNLTRDGWSALFQLGLGSLLATMPEQKVRRAAGRVARRRGAAELADLVPARDGA